MQSLTLKFGLNWIGLNCRFVISLLPSLGSCIGCPMIELHKPQTLGLTAPHVAPVTGLYS